MRANDFFKTLFEDRLGLDVYGLEDIYPYLIDLVYRNTIPVFSQLLPTTFIHEMSLSDKSIQINRDYRVNINSYKIINPTLELFDIQILSLVGCESDSDFSYYQDYVPSTTIDSFDILFGNMEASTQNLISQQFDIQYGYDLVSDNVVQLKNYGDSDNVRLKLTVSYPFIAAIPIDFREELLKLATLDIRVRLYNEFKDILSVPTPNGNFEIKMSEWESSERDREDYLAQLRTRSFPDRVIVSGYYTVF